jgi:hypothetical protein
MTTSSLLVTEPGWRTHAHHRARSPTLTCDKYSVRLISAAATLLA